MYFRDLDFRGILPLKAYWPLMLSLLFCGIFLTTAPRSAYCQGPVGEAAAMGELSRPRPAGFQRPVAIELRGPITPGTLRYFRNRLSYARTYHADLVVVEIESPGGYLMESYEIARMLAETDWAYTVAFCEKEAISGAALISFGCDEIVMSPGARMGDIGVIEMDERLFAYREVPEKIQSDVVAFARALATSKNHPQELIEAMIVKERKAFTRVVGDSKREFMLGKSEDPLPLGEGWEVVAESDADLYMELTGDRALELGLASLNANTLDELGRALKVRGNWNHYRYRTSDSIATILVHPIVTVLLIVIGALALYLEFSAPGIGVGAVVAILCAVLFFWSRAMGGTVGSLEIVLFVLGVVFILMELFVVPGWGITGLLGLGLMFASAVMASQSFTIPHSTAEWNQFITTLLTFLCAGCIVLIGATWVTKKLGRIPVLNQMVLVPQIDGVDAVGSDKSAESGSRLKPTNPTHPDVSVGDWGVAISPLRPAGMVRFARKSLDVVSDGDFIERGEQVRVISIRGSIVTVISARDLEDTQASG